MDDQNSRAADFQDQDLKARHETHLRECAEIRNPPGQHIAKKKRSRGKGTFITRTLVESKAYLSLSNVAPQMLALLLLKREFRKIGNHSKERVCINEDELTLTYVELNSLGITTPRATRGFDELLAKGFIEIRNPGGAYKRDKAVYALSEKWRSWKPGDVIFKRKKSINRGFQGKGKASKGLTIIDTAGHAGAKNLCTERHFQHTNP